MAIFSTLVTGFAAALTLGGQALPGPDPVAGEVRPYVVRAGETLTSIGAVHGVDWRLIARDNDLDSPDVVRAGQTLRIDNRHLVPQAPFENGIVINIPQRMLFHFGGGRLLHSFPAGLGRVDWPTPVGTFEVTARDEDPTWVVPPAIQEEMRRNGRPVVELVPPGPSNPLGAFRIRLDEPGYGIHGTNEPDSVYGFPSHGCIRLRPEDIAELYPLTAIGTPVHIVYEPVLFAALPDGRAFLEVHPDVYGESGDGLESANRLIGESGLMAVDPEALGTIVEEAAGIARPVDVAPRQ